jgi:hypothetical protein
MPRFHILLLRSRCSQDNDKRPAQINIDRRLLSMHWIINRRHRVCMGTVQGINGDV